MGLVVSCMAASLSLSFSTLLTSRKSEAKVKSALPYTPAVAGLVTTSSEELRL